MKKHKIVFVSAVLAFSSCTVPTQYSKSEILEIKRNPDVVNIDIGNPVPESRLAISGSYQYAAGESKPRVFYDTSVVSQDFTIMTTFIDARIFESKHSLSFDFMYGIKDELAAGALIDVSFLNSGIINPDVNKVTCDIGFFLRAIGDIGNFRIGVRPELLLASINGYKSFDDSITIYNGNFHYYHLSERITIFTRYTFRNILAIYSGVQQKRVIYSENEDKFQFENVFGAYAGLSILMDITEISPYVVIPIPSDYTNTSSPFQIGVKTVLTMPKVKLSVR